MWRFSDIPPNESFVEKSTEKTSNVLYGPGMAETKLVTEVSTVLQKKRDDRHEASQHVENGKKITKTKQIITRVFRVRQEITRGTFINHLIILTKSLIIFHLELVEDAPDDHNLFKKGPSHSNDDSNTGCSVLNY